MQTGAQVTQHAVDGILQRLDTLAAKIGTTAAQLWQVYLEQSRVEALRDAGLVVVFLIGAALLLFKAVPFFYKKAELEDDDFYAVCGGAVFFGLVMVGLAVAMLYTSVGEYANPAYWAFQHLSSDLHNMLP